MQLNAGWHKRTLFKKKFACFGNGKPIHSQQDLPTCVLGAVIGSKTS